MVSWKRFANVMYSFGGVDEGYATAKIRSLKYNGCPPNILVAQHSISEYLADHVWEHDRRLCDCSKKYKSQQCPTSGLSIRAI